MPKEIGQEECYKMQIEEIRQINCQNKIISLTATKSKRNWTKQIATNAIEEIRQIICHNLIVISLRGNYCNNLGEIS